MLKIFVPLSEAFDESTNEFVVDKAFTLTLEHSLASLSKWESKHEKPFLGPTPKTNEETLSYINEMSLDGEIPPEILGRLSQENIAEINTYLQSKQTATWFNEGRQPPSREIITAEIIYYWMVSLQIPFECQYWHLNRLLTLVKVINNKNQPAKKQPRMGRNELAAQRRALNEQRQKQYQTSG